MITPSAWQLQGPFFPGGPLHEDLRLMQQVMESALDEMDRKRERLTSVYAIPVLGPRLNNAVHKNLNGKDTEGLLKYWSISHLAGALVDNKKWAGVLECYEQARRVMKGLKRHTGNGGRLSAWQVGMVNKPGHYWVGCRHGESSVTVNLDPWKSLSTGGDDHILVIWLTAEPTNSGRFGWSAG